MAINDGGPAFARAMGHNGMQHFEEHESAVDQEGMSLRDYFAAKAMAAMLSQMTYGNQGQHCAMYDPNDRAQAISLAHLSYQAADAMLQARKISVVSLPQDAALPPHDPNDMGDDPDGDGEI